MNKVFVTLCDTQNWLIYNAGQNVCNIIKKTREIGQAQETLEFIRKVLFPVQKFGTGL